MRQLGEIWQAAERLRGHHFVSAEFMYKPRPPEGRERVVFDFNLRSRLDELAQVGSAVLLICDRESTAESLTPLLVEYPALPLIPLVTNPPLYAGHTLDTPRLMEWDTPDAWRRYAKTDRWHRIDTALRITQQMSDGYLVMPAHDAVWGRGLLARLASFSQKYAQKGVPAAVSVYVTEPHSTLDTAGIPQAIVDVVNAAFLRDATLPQQVVSNHAQQYWGKMGMIPFALCGVVLEGAEQTVFEDDLEIDRVLREAGYAVRALWIDDPAQYSQILSVFDTDGARMLFERTLHYSLSIPADSPGTASLLHAPRDATSISPASAQADALIAEATAAIHARLARYGASWVDWGAYRHVVRPGDPVVEVWRKN